MKYKEKYLELQQEIEVLRNYINELEDYNDYLTRRYGGKLDNEE